MGRYFILLVLIISVVGCGQEPECQPVEKAIVGYGDPRGTLNVLAYFIFEANGEVRELEIKAPFQLENSLGKCFVGKTTKHLSLSPGYYIITALDITDPEELSEIRRVTGHVGDYITPAPEESLREIDLKDNKDNRDDVGATVKFYYHP